MVERTSARRLGCIVVLTACGVGSVCAGEATPNQFTATEGAWIREHVGIYAWPPLGFPDYGHTIGQCADLAEELGTGIVRVIFEPRLLAEPDLIALARTPDYSRLFDGFDVIVLTMPRWDPNEGDAFQATEQAYDAFTRFLLETYSGTGKTFILGFWEGDNAGMTGQPAVEWCRARHRGISAAREAVPADRVRVLEMIECNFDGVAPAPPGLFDPGTCMAATVLPHTAADLYSFSAWMDLPPMPHRSLTAALEALAARAPDSDAFGSRDVMLGESGVPEDLLDPDAHFEAVRGVLAEARPWGTPYVIWWWLSGRELGLVDVPVYGGRKSELWHPFWAAYHAADDPLVIDDFDETDLSPNGYLRNHLGGRHTIWSSHGGGRVRATTEASSDGGALRLRPTGELAPSELCEWRTGLGCFDASRFRLLEVSVVGVTPSVGLRDTRGREAWVPWEPTLRLRRFAHAGVDLSRLASVGLRLGQGTPPEGVLVRRIAFASAAPETRVQSESPAHGVSMVVRGQAAEELCAAPSPAGTVERLAVEAADETSPIISPRLWCGGQQLWLADRIPPEGRAWVEPGVEGRLEITAPSRRRREADFAARGFELHNLRWNPEFHVLMATKPNEPCSLEVAAGAPYTIKGGRFLIEGRKTGAAEWGVTVLQGDAPCEAESVATFQWVEREAFRLPESWTPYQWIRVRFWLKIDRDDDGWEWDGSIKFVHAALDLDVSGTERPRFSADQPMIYMDRSGDDAARLVTVTVKARE